ncbi:InlB B-repeat-containing protein [Flammeovirga sp. SJP92]|uniref:InlB B-repeat-containing protein n=1 Tax=Flammeovirga sp. SJP92 TaxID=1775430 RepID=UPI0007896AB6|nr:InlB B-repeat-containing protein [Flammeovirga sp. SJP92]KXX68047.1 hypothetical protein AVL50_24675 [Flammeovirga sp. SJP92]
MQAKLLLTWLFLMPFLTNFSYAQYTLTDDDVVVDADGVIQSCSYTGGGDIIIPEILDGVTVKEIAGKWGDEGVFYKKNLTSVTFPQTILKIGNFAFHENNIRGELFLPENIDFIGEEAFRYNNIELIQLPYNISRIDNNCFADNNLSDTIEIPSNITSIGYGAFRNNNITKVIFPDYFFHVGNYVFTGNPIEEIVMPNNYFHIEEYSFHLGDVSSNYYFEGWYYDGSFQTKIPIIDTGYKIYGKTIFAKYLPVEYTLLFEEDVVHDNPIVYTIESETITLSDGSKDGYEFEGWYSDSEFTNSITEIPSGSIGNLSLFAKWSSIEYTLTFEEGVVHNNPLVYTVESETITLLEGAKEGYTFEGWYSDSELTNLITEIPSGSIGDLDLYAKWGTIKYTLTDDDVVVDANGVIQSCSYTGGGDIIIPAVLDGVTVRSIGAEAFENKGLTSVVLPNTLRYIEMIAFAYNSINSLELPPNIERIEWWAFYNNSISGELNIPVNAVIGEEAFSTNQIERVNFPNNYTPTSLGNSSFLRNKIKGELVLPNSITTLAIDCFGSNDIETIVLPNNLEVIDSHVFSENNLFGSLSFPESLHTIGDYAFNRLELDKEGYSESAYSWYYDPSYENEVDEMSAENVAGKTIYIKWDFIEYNINYDYAREHSNPLKYNVESSIDLVPPHGKQGFWYTDLSYQNSISSIKPGTTGNINLYGKWENVNYSITYHNDFFHDNLIVEYNIDSPTITLLNASREHYLFEGWYTDSDFTTSITEIPTGSYGDITIYAKWSPIEFALRFEEGVVHDNPLVYTIESETVTLLEGAKEGYTFEGWYTDPEFINSITEIPSGSIGNLSLFAKWSFIEYTLTFEEGVVHDNPLVYSIESETITLLEGVKEGYTFEGWYTDSDLTTSITEISTGSMGNVSIYGKWSLIEYSLTFEEGIVHDNLLAYTIESKTIPLLEGAKEGYTFEGWYTDSDLTTSITEISTGSMGNVSIYGKWSPIEYTLTFEEEVDHDNPLVYTIESEVIVLSEGIKEGYTFEGWYTDSEFTTSITRISTGSIGDISIYAKWTPVEYTLTFEEGVTHDNPLVYTIESEVIVLSDGIKEGYTFEGWYTDSEFTNSITEIVSGSHGNLSLYAKWTPVEYSISFEEDVIHTNPSVYTIESESIVLSAGSKEGYTFEGWFTDASLKNEVTEIASGSIGDLSLYGKWALIEYNITFEENVTHDNPSVYTVEEGVVLASASKEGYVFEGWFTDAEFTNSITEIPVGSIGDVMLYAKFRKDTPTSVDELEGFEITVYPNPADNIVYLSQPVENVRIFNVSGHLLKEYFNTSSVRTTEYQNGVYILQGTVNGSVFNKKIVVRR